MFIILNLLSFKPTTKSIDQYYIYSRNIVTTDYISLSITAWGDCSQTSREYLNRLQRRAVSIIEGRKVEQNEVRTTLKWPSLEVRRKYQISRQVFKCLNGLAPAYLPNQFSFPRDYHSYDTRHKDFIRMPLAKTSKSFKYNGAREWCSLPSYLRQESSLSLFKKNLKRHLCD